MANRLKAYVRRTILTAAREYAPNGRRTKDSTKAAFADAMYGTSTGWWEDLIYTADMLDMAWRYRSDIAKALAEYTDETGDVYVYRAYGEPDTSGSAIALAIATGSKAPTFADYHGDNPAKAARADCMLIGLRFAVEWYAGELAREYCPDL